MNGLKGFRQPSKPDRLSELERMTSNLQMATQVTQQLLKQILGQLELVKGDNTNTINLANDLQYRTLAMIEVGNFSKSELEKEAERLKLIDYNSASDKEDKEKGYVNDDIVKEDSIVIISSTTDSQTDTGIFRSKFPVASCPFEQLKKDLVGKKWGDRFQADLKGTMHTIEIVGVKKILPKDISVESQA